MPAARPRVVIRTAERSRDNRAGEDRIFITRNAVAVLDGASGPVTGERFGGWYADVLGRQLAADLSTDRYRSLAGTLADAIQAVTDEHGFKPGGPSATVSLVRWTGSHVDLLALGDSPIAVLTRDGQVQELCDCRLAAVAVAERERVRHVDNSPGARAALIAAERAARNTPDGYWIAEADPAAASHAYARTFDLEDIAAVLVMTDGVSAGVESYGTPPTLAEAIEIARIDPRVLVDLVHDTESTDPDRVRWPRSKVRDDKAAALIEFRIS